MCDIIIENTFIHKIIVEHIPNLTTKPLQSHCSTFDQSRSVCGILWLHF